MGRGTRHPHGPGWPPERGPSPGPCGQPCSPQGSPRVSGGRPPAAAQRRAGWTAGQPQASAAVPPATPARPGLGPRGGTPPLATRGRLCSWTRALTTGHPEASGGRDEGETRAGPAGRLCGPRGGGRHLARGRCHRRSVPSSPGAKACPCPLEPLQEGGRLQEAPLPPSPSGPRRRSAPRAFLLAPQPPAPGSHGSTRRAPTRATPEGRHRAPTPRPEPVPRVQAPTGQPDPGPAGPPGAWREEVTDGAAGGPGRGPAVPATAGCGWLFYFDLGDRGPAGRGPALATEPRSGLHRRD